MAIRGTFIVALSQKEKEALSRIADDQFRTVNEQATFFIMDFALRSLDNPDILNGLYEEIRGKREMSKRVTIKYWILPENIKNIIAIIRDKQNTALPNICYAIIRKRLEDLGEIERRSVKTTSFKKVPWPESVSTIANRITSNFRGDSQIGAELNRQIVQALEADRKFIETYLNDHTT